jgi:prolycopene isomerase
MNDAYDAVVIGSGLGGLASAATLARAGRRVLVVERHDQPGGYASTFRRGGFTFEVSLHLLDAVEPGEPNRRLLDDLGIATELELLRPVAQRREIWPEHDLVIPYGRDAYLDALSRGFPAERQGLSRLLDLAHAAHDAFHEGTGDVLAPLGVLARSTAGAVVDAHVGDRRLRAMLAMFGRGWLGLPLDELAAVQFLVAWYSFHRYGGSYPRGGSSAIVSALCRVVESAGGSVCTSTAVTRIHIERRRVAAVDLSDGRHIATRLVLSNASPQHTLAIVGGDDARWRARIARLKPSVSCIKVWLGLTSADAAWRDYDLYVNDAYEAGARLDPRTSGLSITMPHVLTGGAPVASVTSLVEHDSVVTREDGDVLVARAARALPSLTQRISLQEVATPATFERFTSNPHGAIYGARATAEQCGARRLPRETPFDGLWLAGAWTQPGAGFSSVLRSGRDAAREALRSTRASRRG